MPRKGKEQQAAEAAVKQQKEQAKKQEQQVKQIAKLKEEAEKIAKKKSNVTATTGLTEADLAQFRTERPVGQTIDPELIARVKQQSVDGAISSFNKKPPQQEQPDLRTPASPASSRPGKSASSTPVRATSQTQQQQPTAKTPARNPFDDDATHVVSNNPFDEDETKTAPKSKTAVPQKAVFATQLNSTLANGNRQTSTIDSLDDAEQEPSISLQHDSLSRPKPSQKSGARPTMPRFNDGSATTQPKSSIQLDDSNKGRNNNESETVAHAPTAFKTPVKTPLPTKRRDSAGNIDMVPFPYPTEIGTPTPSLPESIHSNISRVQTLPDFHSQLTQATNLYLNQTNTGENLYKELYAELDKYSAAKVTELDLSPYQSIVDDNILKTVTEKFPNLKSLNLRGCTLITHAGLSHLSALKEIGENIILPNDKSIETKENLTASLTISKEKKELIVQLNNQKDPEKITELDLSHHHQVVDDNIMEILKNKFPNLVDLNLYGCDKITHKGFSQISGLKKLRTLNLSHTNINGKGLKEISKLPLEELNLSYCREIKEIDFKKIRVEKIETYRTTKYLKQQKVDSTTYKPTNLSKSLKNLNLTGCKITDEALTDLSSLSEEESQLPELLKAEGEVSRLNIALTKSKTHLTNLEQSQYKKAKAKVSELSAQLIKAEDEVDKLSRKEIATDLDQGKLNAAKTTKAKLSNELAQAQKLKEDLKAKRDPQELAKLTTAKKEVAKFTFEKSQAEAKAANLKGELRSLEILNLTDCKSGIKNTSNITDAGIIAVFENFKLLNNLNLTGCDKITDNLFLNVASKTLVNLNLTGCNKITGEGIGMLINFPDLETLNLSECDIDDEKLKFIGRLRSDGRLESLGKKHLKHLILINCKNIKDIGFSHLLELKSQLETLNISGCTGISREALYKLNQFTELLFLDVSGCTELRQRELSQFATSKLQCFNLTGTSVYEHNRRTITRSELESSGIIRSIPKRETEESKSVERKDRSGINFPLVSKFPTAHRSSLGGFPHDVENSLSSLPPEPSEFRSSIGRLPAKPNSKIKNHTISFSQPTVVIPAVPDPKEFTDQAQNPEVQYEAKAARPENQGFNSQATPAKASENAATSAVTITTSSISSPQASSSNDAYSADGFDLVIFSPDKTATLNLNSIPTTPNLRVQEGSEQDLVIHAAPTSPTNAGNNNANDTATTTTTTTAAILSASPASRPDREESRKLIVEEHEGQEDRELVGVEEHKGTELSTKQTRREEGSQSSHTATAGSRRGSEPSISQREEPRASVVEEQEGQELSIKGHEEQAIREEEGSQSSHTATPKPRQGSESLNANDSSNNFGASGTDFTSSSSTTDVTSSSSFPASPASTRLPFTATTSSSSSSGTSNSGSKTRAAVITPSKVSIPAVVIHFDQTTSTLTNTSQVGDAPKEFVKQSQDLDLQNESKRQHPANKGVSQNEKTNSSGTGSSSSTISSTNGEKKREGEEPQNQSENKKQQKQIQTPAPVVRKASFVEKLFGCGSQNVGK